MRNNEQDPHGGDHAAPSPSTQGDAQQGSGGVGSGHATSTPRQGGSQPHLGSQAAQARSTAPGGSGLNEGSNAAEIRARPAGGPSDLKAVDRAGREDAIERADERTGRSPDERARNIGAQTPGDPGTQLSQPEGDGNYQREGDTDVPLAGAPMRIRIGIDRRAS